MQKKEDAFAEHYKHLNELASALVPESIKWIEELKRYRAYQGSDARYFQKARLGVNILGHAVRVCATIEGARSNDLVATRLLGSGDVKKLKA